MVTKTFRILSNSEEFLCAETVGEALLKHITFGAPRPKVYFAVVECAQEAKETQSKVSM